MKKKKSFTLIELLAVIVVLAIIALIATPIVMNTIKSSKKGAAERSGESYVKQVETAMMEYQMNNNGEVFPDGTYSIDENGNLVGDEATLTIEMNGTKPSSGTIKIENGKIKEENSSMTVGNYNVNYDTTNKVYVATEKSAVEVLCTAVTELSTQSVYNQGNIQTGVLVSAGDPYAYGVEYSCNLGDGETKTFYVLEDGDTTTLTEGRIAGAGEVSLIMNMNIDENGKGTTSGNTVAWIIKEDYLEAGGIESDWDTYKVDLFGPITANKYLKNSIKSWKKLNSSQTSLPSAHQLAQVVGKTFVNVDDYFMGSNLPLWLRENLDLYSVPNGYWTSEAQSSLPFACNGSYDGVIQCEETGVVYIDTRIGVRPVITIPKTQLG